MDLRQERLNLRNSAYALLKAESFHREAVTLSSGAKSDFYFDLKPAMLHPEGSRILSDLILHELQGVKADRVGGLEMGAVPIVSTVAMRSQKMGRHLNGFFIRKERKNHGTMKLVEGESIQGKNVVILDDVTTTGESAMLAVRAAREAGATVTLVLSIVDRGEGAYALYEREGVPFKSLFRADEFLKT